MKLTEHFDLREFTHSATAQRQGIANVPDQAGVENLVFDQLIKERQRRDSPAFWIHVSYRGDGGNRQMVMKMAKGER